MKLSVPFRRIMTTFAIAASAVFVPVVASSTPVSAACTWCAGGEYHTLTPTRIFDTRPSNSINDVSPIGAKTLPANSAAFSFDVQLLGLGGLQSLAPGDVLAVAANITVVSPSKAGHLEVFPKGAKPVNRTSVVNFVPSRNVPNMTVLRAGADGKVTIELTGYGAGTGVAHVLIDVFGWWSTSSYAATGAVDDGDERGARLFTPAVPKRILDTRYNGNVHITPNSDRTVKILGSVEQGVGGAVVPNDPNIVGVLLNVTVINPGAVTWLAAVPEAIGGTPPATSNLNVVPGQTKANLVLVPIGAGGNIHIYNHAGFAHLAVDVMGYMIKGQPEATRKGRVIPLTAPFRAFDTRQAQFGAVPLGPGQAEDWSFANFAGSVNVGGVSVGKQSGFLGNLTNAKLTRQFPTVSVTPGYMTACPGPCPVKPNTNVPAYSNLNTMEGWVVPNMALVSYGANQTVRVFNERGYSHYIVDVSAVILAD